MDTEPKKIEFKPLTELAGIDLSAGSMCGPDDEICAVPVPKNDETETKEINE